MKEGKLLLIDLGKSNLLLHVLRRKVEVRYFLACAD